MKHVSITGGPGCRARRAAPIVMLSIMIAFLAPTRSDAQINWTNYGSLVLGTGPSWDSNWVGFVSVVYQDSHYVMWYSGGTNGNGIDLSVGRATSPDAVNWTKDTLNPVMKPDGSSWDGLAAWLPKVLKIGSGYTMWFTGSTASSLWQIGRATSSDGRVWARDTSNPVVRVGAPGQWDAGLVHTGSVLFDGTTYRMWYTGMSVGYGSGTCGIGLATSADGIHWVKDTADNPVLAAGAGSAWDAHGVGECSVVYDSSNRQYLMFYNGNELDFFFRTSGIGYASSPDGIHWTKYGGNPVLANGQPGATVANSPFVLLTNTTLHMWYGGDQGMRYATSPLALTGARGQSNATIAGGFQLQQNYPNPFNPSTTISFTIPKAGFVTLKVYDLLGNELRTLLSGEVSAGPHESIFNASGLASGVYFYRLQSGSFNQTRKLILSR